MQRTTKFKVGDMVSAAKNIVDPSAPLRWILQGEVGSVREVVRKKDTTEYDVAFIGRPGLWICNASELNLR
jgi:hypothetical protein